MEKLFREIGVPFGATITFDEYRAFLAKVPKDKVQEFQDCFIPDGTEVEPGYEDSHTPEQDVL